LLRAVSLGSVLWRQYLHRQRPELHGQEHRRAVRLTMPSFFGYMLYSIGILIPLVLLITFVFFR
jgi:hypothetical protein